MLSIRYREGHSLTDSGAGHLWWWQHEEVHVVEKNILEEYGAVARWNGPFGVCFSSSGLV